MAWVGNFDKEAALVELVERGVPMETAAKVCSKGTEDAEHLYRETASERHSLIADAKKKYGNDSDKLQALEHSIS
jgi:hypothetical protein